jgi:hypothetical protein
MTNEHPPQRDPEVLRRDSYVAQCCPSPASMGGHLQTTGLLLRTPGSSPGSVSQSTKSSLIGRRQVSLTAFTYPFTLSAWQTLTWQFLTGCCSFQAQPRPARKRPHFARIMQQTRHWTRRPDWKDLLGLHLRLPSLARLPCLRKVWKQFLTIGGVVCRVPPPRRSLAQRPGSVICRE